jgi:hypothetical protein
MKANFSLSTLPTALEHPATPAGCSHSHRSYDSSLYKGQAQNPVLNLDHGWARLNFRSGPTADGPNPLAETNRNEHTRRSIISSFLVFCHVLRSLRPAKRSRALVETNPARNSRSETHQDDGSGSRLRTASFLALHRVDRSPYAWKNSLLPFHQPPQARFFFRSLLVSDSPVRNGVVARCSS